MLLVDTFVILLRALLLLLLWYFLSETGSPNRFLVPGTPYLRQGRIDGVVTELLEVVVHTTGGRSKMLRRLWRERQTEFVLK